MNILGSKGADSFTSSENSRNENISQINTLSSTRKEVPTRKAKKMVPTTKSGNTTKKLLKQTALVNEALSPEDDKLAQEIVEAFTNGELSQEILYLSS